ncbi:Txe/YoeB family addiction module toxin [Staphylococcus pettenkoferi]|uniref:Endoribonuclease YoeB n=1 Tax=Staphylococcus pettenkoferi TaxID=170573 RepID=A0ABT4BLK1_9STAP|nr:Txe/YoeB family addiction module toxin [Staphylococcus pettenkoferi]MCI2803204.1 Txe/YoeB family addiction module toxin [Staphylococcus pettenkoferi]MCY1564512.1 Txe/YoeB family addiction module toxin [Staphylococcus pettenkoferi]MCY1572278.1 Txe/YoeB family addiction module toxin [Staphylococcus pettenkoferi]MCY1583468.1 Txe/YoeB family addiction module toxin [Staphylococcus pettenkoferi]MCY1589156.1 Txe/YoeB family addiction module toxin [Staphylococcus pettenkoferi]
MSRYQVKIKNSAQRDLKKLKRSHLKSAFLNIVEELKVNPYSPKHSFKLLQPPHLRRYSRRLNLQHRVVYTVDDSNKIVYILSAWSHYE